MPVNVSPPEGTRAVTLTRSVFREPITVIVLGAILKLVNVVARMCDEAFAGVGG